MKKIVFSITFITVLILNIFILLNIRASGYFENITIFKILDIIQLPLICGLISVLIMYKREK